MYNLLRYSSVLLVLLSNFKTLTGLPYEVQPVPVEQPPAQPSALLPAPINDAASLSDVAHRSLNVTDSNPSARSALQSATNVTVDAVAPRSLPVAEAPVAAAPAQAPAQPLPIAPTDSQAVAERSALNLNVQAAEAPQAAPNASAPELALRSGLENTPSAVSNVSSVETRSLNVSAEVAPRAANEMQAGLIANVPPAPANNATSPPSSGFVPSFLRNYGLRLKRGEELLGASNESVVSVRSSLEQSPSLSNGAAVAQTGELDVNRALAEENSGDSKIAPVSAGEVSLRSGLDQSPAAGNSDLTAPGARVSVESTVAEVNLARGLPSVRSGLEESLNQELPASPSSANIPYVNVYPVGKVYYV